MAIHRTQLFSTLLSVQTGRTYRRATCEHLVRLLVRVTGQ
jgi:hypothetical protein